MNIKHSKIFTSILALCAVTGIYYAFTKDSPAAAEKSTAPTVMRGKLVIGHEVRSFTPDGSNTSYWVVDKSGKLAEAYQKVVGDNAKPYTPVNARLAIVDAGKSKEGFAADYASVYQVQEILDVHTDNKLAFVQNLKWDDISFYVEKTDNTLKIKSSGLKTVNEELTHSIIGYSVANIEVGDLDKDSFPELFVYLRSHGSGSYGKLIGYSVNKGKSMSLVHMLPLDKKQQEGYMGHDTMKLDNDALLVSFPVYKDTDPNAKPSGGRREIKYKLLPGEAGKVLKPEA